MPVPLLSIFCALHHQSPQLPQEWTLPCFYLRKLKLNDAKGLAKVKCSIGILNQAVPHQVKLITPMPSCFLKEVIYVAIHAQGTHNSRLAPKEKDLRLWSIKGTLKSPKSQMNQNMMTCLYRNKTKVTPKRKSAYLLGRGVEEWGTREVETVICIISH